MAKHANDINAIRTFLIGDSTQIANKDKEDDIESLFDETQQCPTCGILCTSKAHLALHLKVSRKTAIFLVCNFLRY